MKPGPCVDQKITRLYCGGFIASDWETVNLVIGGEESRYSNKHACSNQEMFACLSFLKTILLFLLLVCLWVCGCLCVS